MARGWESKSVEAQQAEAAAQSTQSHPRISEEQAAILRRKETLRLSRQRVLEQLKTSSSPLHRKLLQDSLADLDAKLSRLES
jgi:hypothetical protein